MTQPGNVPNPIPDDALTLPLLPVPPANPVLVVEGKKEFSETESKHSARRAENHVAAH